MRKINTEIEHPYSEFLGGHDVPCSCNQCLGPYCKKDDQRLTRFLQQDVHDLLRVPTWRSLVPLNRSVHVPVTDVANLRLSREPLPSVASRRAQLTYACQGRALVSSHREIVWKLPQNTRCGLDVRTAIRDTVESEVIAIVWVQASRIDSQQNDIARAKLS